MLCKCKILVSVQEGLFFLGVSDTNIRVWGECCGQRTKVNVKDEGRLKVLTNDD